MDVGIIGQGGPISIDYTGKVDEAFSKQVNKTEEVVVNALQGKIDRQDTISKDEVKKAVNKLNKFLEGENVHVEYEVHKKLKDLMIRIVDNNTKEVVLEIPPKKILDLVAKMMETVGILLDEKA